MKLIAKILLLALFSPFYMVRAQRPEPNSDFLINASRPYVYVEVDHVGPRKPMRENEPNTGLWLRLTNNCKLPIVVAAIGSVPENAKGALTLEDEVVPNHQVFGEDARMTGVATTQGFEAAVKNMDDIVRFPNMTEVEVRSAEAQEGGLKKPSERPVGYSPANGFDSLVLTLVPSGGQVYFSVPANHVSKTWHFEIPFRLAVPNNSRIRPPYSYVALYWDDLTEADRSLILKAEGGESAKP